MKEKKECGIYFIGSSISYDCGLDLVMVGRLFIRQAPPLERGQGGVLKPIIYQAIQ